MIRRIVFAASVLGWSHLGMAATANPSADERSREACRRIAAGDYLSVNDELQRGEQLVKRLKTKETRLQRESEQARRDHAKAVANLGPAEYETGKLKAIDDAKARLELVTANLQETNKALTDSQAVVKTAQTRHDALKRSLSQVFVISKRQTQPLDTYPWELSYKHACPKYRSQCALPEQQRHQLLHEITPLLHDPEPCRRYSQQDDSSKNLRP